MEPVGEPTGTRLEEGDPHLGVAVEGAGEEQARHGCHLLHRVRQRVAFGEGGEPVRADRRMAAEAETLVHRQHQLGILDGRVDGLVFRVAEVAAVHVVGAGEHRHQVVVGAPLHLLGRPLGVDERDHPDAGETPAVGGCVVADPLVVGPAGLGRRGGVELRLEGHHEPERRVEHHRVDALGVHRPQIALGAPPALHLVLHQRAVAAHLHRRGVGEVDGELALFHPVVEHPAGLDHVGVGVEDAVGSGGCHGQLLRTAGPPCPLIVDGQPGRRRPAGPRRSCTTRRRTAGTAPPQRPPRATPAAASACSPPPSCGWPRGRRPSRSSS